MRAFLGIDLTDAATLCALDEIRTKLGVPKSSIPAHFTIAFFGEIDQAFAERIYSHLCLLEFEAFNIEIGSLSAFPTILSPRIVWVGVQKGHDKITALASDIDTLITPLGFLRDHQFTPHITISRIKNKTRQILDVLKENTDIRFGSQLVDKILLKRSDATNDGHAHTVLQTVRAIS